MRQSSVKIKMRLAVATLIGFSPFVLLMIILNIGFQRLQFSLFKSPDDLLFFQSESIAIPVGLVIVLFIFSISFAEGINKFTFLRFKTSVLSIGLVVFLLTIGITFLGIFKYTKMNEDGFIIKKSILAKSEVVDWNNVDIAKVECVSGTDKNKDKIYFRYYILLKNGEKINLRMSKDFRKWDKAIFIDKYIEEKGVNIVRDRINGATLDKLVAQYKDEYEEHTESVIWRMFRYGK